MIWLTTSGWIGVAHASHPASWACATSISELVSRISPSCGGDPTGTISSPVGITATRGFRRTCSSVAPAAAAAATSTGRSRCPSGSSSTASDAKLVGEPEEVDLDGAVMKCQAAKGTNKATKQEKTDWFCAWADYSTIAMVSPGDVTKGITKDVAIDITTKLRNEVRVKA